jgi:hypothetical protein
MAETFEALAVILIAVLPGGSYVWGFERQLGAWGSGASDRLLRLIGVSAAIHAVAAPLSYWLWATVVEPGRLARGEPLSWLAWLVPIVYVGLPWLLGTLLGWAARERRPLLRPLDRIVRMRSPLAWDHLWSEPDLRGWVRVRLKTGEWIAGAFGAKFEGGPASHASRYPEAGDLWLAPAIGFDELGRLQAGDRSSLRGVLLRWEEVAYLEFQPGGRRAEGE